MATNHTTNYQLNLWQPGDSFLREEFNENSEKLDAALAGLAGRAVTGTATTMAEQATTVNLGFRPKLLLVCSSKPYFAIAMGNTTCIQFRKSGNDLSYIENGPVCLTDTGFYIPSGSYPLTSTNCPTTTIRYFAIR